MTSGSSAEDYLIDQIKKSGKPLEIRISSLLDGRWTDVSNQDTFYDRDERKLREIDICASHGPKRTGNVEFEATCVIECKKSEAFSWVFFTRPFKYKFENVMGQYLDEVQMAAKNTERTEIMNVVLGKTPLHYEGKQDVAVTYEAFKTGDVKQSQFREDQNAIFEAQNQLKSYIDYGTEQSIRERVSVIPYSVEVYFPCIVFRGKLYEAKVKDDDVKLKESRHLILKALYKSPYSIYERDLLIDVVVEEYFNDYQELVRKDIGSLEQTIRSNSKTINSRITEIVSLLESAAKGK